MNVNRSLNHIQADPGPVASIFWVDDELESSIYLDGIVTVVDAKNVVRHLDDEKSAAHGDVNEAERQIAFADMIILNKKDLVSESDTNYVEERVRAINKLAPIIFSEKCRVDLDKVIIPFL